ncbi:GNAT family N-acetyltransferase [Mangrovibacillus cuniculi]|uniref:GNAT family N-acetyltransferase n=1 Tax=Mangrovibacillus cuniculi TaxID=2593652 RepID=A0A7S8HEI7_9BACI|nr:GNAT family N-acetyltransferase [Mangrovibacillus cuniculi]QPC45874.1 GNAT family N-acetyltransferase [Mangrovibacillus cuniculi]
MEVKIQRLETIEEASEQLSNLLVKVVNEDASIGFLPGLTLGEAKAYWQSVIQPETLLFVAKVEEHIVGSIQLHLCTKPNGLHRIEIAKLITHPNYRRNGIGRKLMQIAEDYARELDKSLIVLDTREGDPSNFLYQSMEYVNAGSIPYYALSGDGQLHATVLYYKTLK